MAVTKKDKVIALKALEKDLKANQKACKAAWPEGSPLLSLCMQKAASVFESQLEKVLCSQGGKVAREAEKKVEHET
ncbi:MAG: hypothetical protein OQL17_00555 [Sedimenticola sp.]|uniref:Uncharacterized protein n=1 Tax=Sedimenticola thiotaurini TaxID=1543721 RepID=A0A558D474_9GAMM|nr:hypothetical protein [Sedimenticola sp.]MCW8920110.1 hypothetical protein [Sedimenticola sp.]MCW8948440.1 hypothetical protein [Sedimenticola sp.]TVT55804.1 MAG: hypothetical protein FHK82_07660 [Sedimenticola thiotaurini]